MAGFKSLSNKPKSNALHGKPRAICPTMMKMYRSEKTYAERKQDWWKWHCANPDVWLYFERFSLEAISRGRTKISHWLIINRIRWEVNIVTTGEDFKISNDYIAFYARLWNARYPQYKNLFTIKKMIGEVCANP